MIFRRQANANVNMASTMSLELYHHHRMDRHSDGVSERHWHWSDFSLAIKWFHQSPNPLRITRSFPPPSSVWWTPTRQRVSDRVTGNWAVKWSRAVIGWWWRWLCAGWFVVVVSLPALAGCEFWRQVECGGIDEWWSTANRISTVWSPLWVQWEPY